MYEKIVSLILALSLFLSIPGCSSSVVIPRDTVPTQEYHIDGVFLDTGEFIEYDYAGGRVKMRGPGITALNRSGHLVQVPMERIIEARKVTTPAADSTRLPGARILEVIRENNRLVKFNAAGGRYDEQRKSIGGISQGGEPIHLIMDSIREVRTDPPELLAAARIEEATEVVITPHATVIELFGPVRYHDAGRYVEGSTIGGKVTVVDFKDIRNVQVRESNSGNTVLLVLGGAVVGVVLAAYISFAKAWGKK